jgi:pyruvate/2-oxoglutarate/acetoin dehydrogenase E1 component
LNQLKIEISDQLKLEIDLIINNLNGTKEAIRKDIMTSVRKALRIVRGEKSNSLIALKNWKTNIDASNYDRYSSYLFSYSESRASNIQTINAAYSESSAILNGFEVLNKVFDSILEKENRFFAIGEDVGKIGDVNQGFSGLQAKYGELRITDTGIREMTIVGQGLGAAMRGLKPMVEIQYLDYLLYALQIMSDDIATLQYRTKGGQKAPLIIRTRGHRLEGIWHSGSPIGMILHALRGINVLVPRNMVQAAGMYNLLIQSDEPALVIECLNGYRLKERLPDNYDSFTVPLGKVEILRTGTDLTIVTYGSCCRIAMEAAEQLKEVDIDVEIIDVQSLLPFDLDHDIVNSLKKTNRILFLDEDVPGGATAYMMQKVLEEQKGYYHLDSPAATLTAKNHRPAYGSDGDYFSKPSADDVFEKVYTIMQDAEPGLFPKYLD